MYDYHNHIMSDSASLEEALSRLNKLASDAILFIVNDEEQLVGSLTDGDIRRGLLKGKKFESKILEYTQTSPQSIYKDNYSIEKIIELRQKNIKIIPVLDRDSRIINVINFRIISSYLPVDAVIMAGGRGSRLRPMTDKTPKPLLKVGNKSIIDHNIDRLRKFGIDDFYISLGYLGEQIEKHYKIRNLEDIKLNFIWEENALGTIGAVSLIDKFQHEYVLITNSDLLTTLNYEHFFLDFLEKKADMSVATIPYQINIPYAVMETRNNFVTSFKEKPTFTYHSNGGIYLVRRKILKGIPKNSFYNATDLMEKILKNGGKLISYPIHQYWLDIGKPEDFDKAQVDIKNLEL